MAGYSTPEDVKKQYVAAMGEALGLIFYALWEEVAWLHFIWQDFLELFASKSRRAILNRAAPAFFRMTQDTLFEAIILDVARLTDPPGSMGKPNLTIQRLAELIDHGPTREQLTQHVGQALTAAKFCRDRRNRQIAHRDLHLVLGDQGVQPLEPASLEKIRTAITALAATLNVISEHYLNATIAFDAGVRKLGGAVSLLYVLRDGIKVDEERKERFQRGDFRPEDRENREI